MTPSRPTYRAMIVNDNGAIKETLKDILYRLNCPSIKEAYSDQDTFSLLKQRIDLIILSLNADIQSAFETLQQIKQEHKFKSIPVICLTANARQGVVQKALELEVDDFIVQPASSQILSTRLDRALKKKPRS